MNKRIDMVNKRSSEDRRKVKGTEEVKNDGVVKEIVEKFVKRRVEERRGAKKEAVIETLEVSKVRGQVKSALSNIKDILEEVYDSEKEQFKPCGRLRTLDLIKECSRLDKLVSVNSTEGYYGTDDGFTKVENIQQLIKYCECRLEIIGVGEISGVGAISGGGDTSDSK